LFPNLLLPDIHREIGSLRQAITGTGASRSVNELAGPDYDPDIFVVQKCDSPKYPEQRANEWFRIRVYSRELAREPFEPEDEDRFVDLVHEVFEEDSFAELEASLPNGVLVQYRDGDLRFHRRWGWWTMGAIGMAATLPDLHRPGAYSAADVVIDLTRLLRLTRRVCQKGPARALFEIEPSLLRVEWAPSHVIARERLGSQLRGVLSTARQRLDRSGKFKVQVTFSFENLAGREPAVAGEMVWRSMRELYGARIRKQEFLSSVPEVIEAVRRAHRL
jgi:hypothetical protein